MMNEHEPLHIPRDYVERLFVGFWDVEAEDFMRGPDNSGRGGPGPGDKRRA